MASNPMTLYSNILFAYKVNSDPVDSLTLAISLIDINVFLELFESGIRSNDLVL